MTKNSVAPGVHKAEAGEPCLKLSHQCIVDEELPPLLPWPRTTSSPPPPALSPSSRTQFTSHPFHGPPAALSFPLTYYPFLSVPAPSDLFLRLFFVESCVVAGCFHGPPLCSEGSTTL